jgi:hypothetical protein
MTVDAAADRIGKTPRRIQQIAKELNLERYGRQFIIKESDLPVIKAIANGRRGRKSKLSKIL